MSFGAEVDIEVYDIMGKLVRKENNILYVDLNKGLYLVKIKKENVSLTTKIIVQ